MAELKTKETKASVEKFLAAAGPDRQADCRTLVALMKKATGCPPKMWGPSIVGFGSFHYKYASGHEGDTCLVGFSPRKGELSIYLSFDLAGQFGAELKKLGRHRAGKGCLYVKRLADVDLKVLEAMIETSVAAARKRG